jgi:hypothetical protein
MVEGPPSTEYHFADYCTAMECSPRYSWGPLEILPLIASRGVDSGDGQGIARLGQERSILEGIWKAGGIFKRGQSRSQL